MNWRSRITIAVVAVGVGLGGCVDDRAPRESAEGQWHLSSVPSVRIGVVAGEEPYQFHQIVAVRRLADGRTIVANGGTQDLRFYDHAGRHLMTVGRPGSGPGEFQVLGSIEPYRADSLVAFDAANRRVSILDPDGRFARSWTVESPGRGVFPSRAIPLADGSILIVHFRGHMPGDPSGVIRFSAPVTRYSEVGAMLNVIAEVPGEEWYRSAGTLTYRPFARKGHVAVHDGSIVVGDSERPDILVYDGNGQVLRSIAAPDPQAPVTASDIRLYRDQRLALVDDVDGRHRLHQLLEEMDYPERMPAFDALLVDAEGNLWVQRYSSEDTSSARWSVVAPDGQQLALVETPANLRVQQITDGFIVGTTSDELGVEFVEIYELRRDARLN